MTENNEWQRVRSEQGPDLKLFHARFDYMRNPRNAQTERMIILESPDSVNIVAVTDKQEILFVRQYRFGIGEYTLELPGGIVDPGEEHGIAAHRELQEETGHSAQKWQYLGRIPSNPVFMDSYVHHWWAAGVKHTHDLKLDIGEDVEVVLLPISEVKEKLFSGQFQHPHAVNALLCFFHHYEEDR
ncbi:MAG: ADP-ribose pyrophosphatase [Saprospiraceae bacterium]|nr:MAG: ADP-ribose pyrophosphatase [Saprospiraceae bacterium]